MWAGNPWRVEPSHDFWVVKNHCGGVEGGVFEARNLALAYAISQFRAHVLENPGPLEELRGKNLACWCSTAPGTPCHADVLLELSNRPQPPASIGDERG